MNALIREVEKQFLRTLPDFNVGDTVKVDLEITEGDKKRLQAFEGTVMRRHGNGMSSTVTLRKISGGVAVEKIVPLHLPGLKTMEVLRRGKVRRAKLYYLRSLLGKAARIDEEMTASPVSSASLGEPGVAPGVATAVKVEGKTSRKERKAAKGELKAAKSERKGKKAHAG